MRRPTPAAAAGVVHRDLKPLNVLIAEDDPRVIDSGISPARITVSAASSPASQPSDLAAAAASRPISADASAWRASMMNSFRAVWVIAAAVGRHIDIDRP